MKKFFLLITLLLPFVAQALPFVPTTNPAADDTHWYYLKTGNMYLYNSVVGLGGLSAASVASATDNYIWCFVGTESTGYKIYNLGKRAYLQDGFVFGDGSGNNANYYEAGYGNEFYIYYMEHHANPATKFYLCYDARDGFVCSQEKFNSYTVTEVEIAPPLDIPYNSLIIYDYLIPHNDLSNTASEGFQKLVDRDKETDWTVVNSTGKWETIWVDFISDVEFIPTAYEITTGTSITSYPNRNPKAWKIYAKAQQSDPWTVIVDVTNGSSILGTDYGDYRFKIDGITQAYRYFRFEVSQINGVEQKNGNYTFQLAELQFGGQRVVEPVKGDVTGDGKVDVEDVNAAINIILELTDLNLKADITGDGKVDVEDVNKIINIILDIDTPDGARIYNVNGVKFKMVKVDGGTFTMGATSEQDGSAQENELPTHQVTLSSYAIGETEVTQELWQAVMGDNPSYYKGNLQNPVENVSWYDCIVFINKLNEITGKHFRLPTEAEWEYAARGGNKSQGYKYAGNDVLGLVAWYYTNTSNKTHPVGQLLPNELGLYDMSGNVSEYTQDDNNPYSSEPQTNPVYDNNEFLKIHRGGGIYDTGSYCRVSARIGRVKSAAASSIGLRLVM